MIRVPDLRRPHFVAELNQTFDVDVIRICTWSSIENRREDRIDDIASSIVLVFPEQHGALTKEVVGKDASQV